MVGVVFKRDLDRLNFLERVFPARADKFAEKLARKTADIMHGSWSPSSPSSPGEPPAKVSGDLDQSIEVVHVGQGEWAVTVSAPHAGFLEKGTVYMQARPYIEPAADMAAQDLDREAKAVYNLT